MSGHKIIPHTWKTDNISWRLSTQWDSILSWGFKYIFLLYSFEVLWDRLLQGLLFAAIPLTKSFCEFQTVYKITWRFWFLLTKMFYWNCDWAPNLLTEALYLGLMMRSQSQLDQQWLLRLVRLWSANLLLLGMHRFHFLQTKNKYLPILSTD